MVGDTGAISCARMISDTGAISDIERENDDERQQFISCISCKVCGDWD